MAESSRQRASLSRIEAVGALVIVVGGTLWHFAYDWTGHNSVVAVVAPANESVWEHLKLVLVPVIAFGIVEGIWIRDRARLWWSKLIEIVSSCLFIVAVFYTYTGALGVASVVGVDIGSFVVAILAGQWISYRLQMSARRPPPLFVSVAVLLALVVIFAVVTFAPPHVPLFQVHSTGLYGPSHSGSTH